MTFTYDIKSPATRDKVRLLIGDTLQPPKNIFEDEELDTILALEESDVRLSAALALDAIANNAAKVAAVVQMPGVNLTTQEIYKAYSERADKMRALAQQDAQPQWSSIYDDTSQFYDTVLGRTDIELGELGGL